MTGEAISTGILPSTDATRGRSLSSAAILNELMVVMMMLASILFEIGAKTAQTGVELSLLVILVFACTRLTFDRFEIVLLVVLFSMTGISLAVNPWDVFVLDAKQLGLAVLTLLYFSKVRYRSALIFPAFALSIVLILFGIFVPSVVAPLVRLAVRGFNEVRFGGLFLNAHVNAYFLAIALIYYEYRWRIFGIGTLVLWLTTSKFVLASYLASLISRLRIFRSKSGKWTAAVALVVGGVLVVIYGAQIVNYMNTDKLFSGAVILMQLLDYRFYLVLLTPYPGDYSGLVNLTTVGLRGLEIGNEVALFAVFTQAGAVLAVLYLYKLFKQVRHYRVFVAVSLLHYGFVLSPLMIYMLVTYSREIELLSLERSAAREKLAA